MQKPWMLMRNQNVLWSEPDLAGYLEKRDRKFNAWKRRLFLLQGYVLYYFTNEHQVQTMAPSAVIPLEGSLVKFSGTTDMNRFVFELKVGDQYTGLVGRDCYVLAADSREASDAWIRMLKIASYSREVLNCKLKKSGTSLGKLKCLLSASPADRKILDTATGYQIDELQRKLRQANRKKEALVKEVEEAVLAADKREFALARATARWTSLATRGEVSKYLSKLEKELKTIEQLYKLLETKGNLYQAEKIENLRQDAQMVLRTLVKRALGAIQDHHAKIRARAPRFSFHVDPVIYREESFGKMAHVDGSGEREYRNKPKTAEVSNPERFYSRFVTKKSL